MTSFISLSQDTYTIPLRLFSDNRCKLANKLCEASVVSASESTVTRMDDDNVTVRREQTETYSSNEQLKVEETTTSTVLHVVLKGGPSPQRYDTDHEPVFRQESYFWWLTGVKEPDCDVVISVELGRPSRSNGSSNDSDSQIRCSTVRSITTTLFVPKLPPSYATIMGRIKTLAEWKDMYQVDNVLYTNELESYLKTHIASSSSDGSDHEEQCNTKILLMKGRNTDSGSMYEPPKLFDKDNEGDEKIMTKYIDDEILFPILAECRVIKSDDELALLEYVSQVSSFAHAYVMRNVFKTAATVAAPAGTTAASTTLTSSPVEYEYQCESLFRHYAYFNYGCRLVSYTSICGCGPNSAILHYGHAGEPNSRKINYVGQDHVLFDMGAEYMCYASDITVSFPVNGTFSSKYRPVYESVLDAQRAVIAMIRPGVSWVDCHKAAEIEILKGLYKIGIIQIPSGDGEVDDDEDASGKGTDAVSILQDLNERHRFGAVFMPHGLGHFLGIDTHDVGGYLPGHPERSPLPGLKSLRTARTLKERMVLTVEPGCYFIDHLLDGAMHDPILSKYLNHDLINTEYRGYGGVRLEDVVTVVTPSDSEDNHNKFVPGSGCINFTLCPRTVEEVEHVMAGGKWPPLKDAAPELRRVRLASPISPLPPPPSF